MTFREVLNAIQDANGCIDSDLATRIIDSHGLAVCDYFEETQDVKFHVNELADWLGY